MKKQQIVLTLSLVIATSSLLMTACGNKEETVSAMNTILVETEVSTETTDISGIESEAETESITETESETETESVTETEVETSAKEYTLEVIDVTMYALSDSYTYDGPSTFDYDQKATVHEEEQVRVIGKVNEADWYKIEQEGGITSFISAEFLTEEVPAVEAPSTPQTSQPTQNPQTQTQSPQPEEQTPPSTSKPEVAGEVSASSEPGGRLINPDTGEYYKAGDTAPDGTVYGGFYSMEDLGF